MDVQFWGVRGSIAVSGGAFLKTGGHTTCVQLEQEGHTLILDGGTGLAALGAALAPSRATTVLFTHLHWDHIQGVPFFAPAFDPDHQLTLAGPTGLQAALASQMKAPMFPIGLDALRASLRFVELDAGHVFEVGPFRVHVGAMSHPDGVLVYRVEAGGRSMVFATDVEHGEHLDPHMVKLALGADFLVHDAQYTDAEYRGTPDPSVGRPSKPKKGWGHSTWEQAVEVARLAQVGRLALFHHDPQRTDAQLAVLESIAARTRAGTFAAREGDRVAL